MSAGIGIGTGLALAAGGSAAASIYGANKQANAAQQASAQQQAAAQQALQQTSPLYSQALQIAQQQALAGNAALAPYAQQGGAGLTALTAFLGVPQGTAAPTNTFGGLRVGNQVTIPATAAQQASATAAIPSAVVRPSQAVPWSTTAGPGLVAVRSRGGQTGYVPTARVPDAMAAGAQPLNAADVPSRVQPTVLLEAPDGSRMSVPTAHAPALIAKGAKMVG